MLIMRRNVACIKNKIAGTKQVFSKYRRYICLFYEKYGEIY